MPTMIEYLAAFQEPFPIWLDEGNYTLRNFFASRTVYYPGGGMDGHPLKIFNGSHSAHCFFYVDQKYTEPNLTRQLGNAPDGYTVVFEKPYCAQELQQEAIFALPENYLNQFTIAPIDGTFRDYEYPPRPNCRSPADDQSAARLLIYERCPDHGETHGARRFAVFCLGMEARKAYEWFYGTMFMPYPPFTILLQDHGFGGDWAKSHPLCNDCGFGDPNGSLYNASLQTGLPEFLLVDENNVERWGGNSWPGYAPIVGVFTHRGGVTAGFDRKLFRRMN